MIFIFLCILSNSTVLINSQERGNGHPWNDVYFIPVTNYLIFNSGDYLGRILAGLIEWVISNAIHQHFHFTTSKFCLKYFVLFPLQPNDKPYLVATMSMLRIAFLPALLLCNTNPRHNMPVMIHSDYIFILLMCFFAFSNGYLANIAMIWAPK